MSFFDKFADDVLGIDPNGGGIFDAAKTALPFAAAYLGFQSLGGIEGIQAMFGPGAGAAGTKFTEAQLAAANASADPIGYLSSAATSGGGGFLDTLGKYAGPISSVGNALLGSYSANKAAGVQSAAVDRSAELQRQTAREQSALLQRMYEEGVKRQQPFYNVGVNALPKLVAASKYTPFTMQQFQQDPGYAFRIKEGQKRLDRSAAARGGLISGGALKAATEYGQEMASQEYNNAFNRYQTERAARLNPLQSLTGMGQTTANTIGTAGQNYATGAGNIAGTMAANVGEAYQGAANARASGYMGMANAVGGGLNQFANYQQNQQMNSLLEQALRNRG